VSQVTEGPPLPVVEEPGVEEAEADDMSNPMGLEDADVAFTNQQAVHLGLIKVCVCLCAFVRVLCAGVQYCLSYTMFTECVCPC
jgi:hypothetical protein